VKLDRSTIREVAHKPRKNARLKANNSFPINKTILKNRAFLRGFCPELALFGTGRSNSQPRLTGFHIFPCFPLVGLCFAFFNFGPTTATQTQPRQVQSQFNMLSQLPLAIGGYIRLE